MGHRLELFFIFAIALILVVPFTIKITNSNQKNIQNNKTTEVNNFIEYEINATKVQHILKGKQAKQVNNNWYVKEPKIETDNIKELSSKRSIVTQKNIEFIKDVVVIKKDGIKYRSQKAIYNRENQDILTPNKFIINRVSDIVYGKELYYDTKGKVTKAKDVNGTFVLKKRNN